MGKCKIENCMNYCYISSKCLCDICYEKYLSGKISHIEYEIAKNKKIFPGYSKKERKKIKERTPEKIKERTPEKVKKGIADSVAEGTKTLTKAILTIIMILFLIATIAYWLPSFIGGCILLYTFCKLIEKGRK